MEPVAASRAVPSRGDATTPGAIELDDDRMPTMVPVIDDVRPDPLSLVRWPMRRFGAPSGTTFGKPGGARLAHSGRAPARTSTSGCAKSATIVSPAGRS